MVETSFGDSCTWRRYIMAQNTFNICFLYFSPMENSRARFATQTSLLSFPKFQLISKVCLMFLPIIAKLFSVWLWWAEIMGKLPNFTNQLEFRKTWIGKGMFKLGQPNNVTMKYYYICWIQGIYHQNKSKQNERFKNVKINKI